MTLYAEEGPSNEMGKSYVDHLVRVFAANPAVEKAYFGLLYNEEQEQNDLFLSIDHQGNDREIMGMTAALTQSLLPHRKMVFTSAQSAPEYHNFIRNANFAFYVRQRYPALNIAIMKQWFEPERYERDFLFQVTTGKLSSLFTGFDPQSNILNFQTYIRDGREFIPLFSDAEMVYKSGMTEVPPDLTVLEFEWEKLNETVDGRLRQHLYVLNPGTSFEVEFTI